MGRSPKEQIIQRLNENIFNLRKVNVFELSGNSKIFLL